VHAAPTPAPAPAPTTISANKGSASASSRASNIGSGGSYSTTFGSAENPLSEGGKWVDGKAIGLKWNNPKTVGGQAVAAVLSGLGASRYDDSIGHLSKSFIDFGDNQFSRGTVYRAQGYTPPSGSAHEIELLTRFEITANSARGYETMWGMSPGSSSTGAYLAMVRWNGPLGDYTTIYDSTAGGGVLMPAPVNGDVLEVQIIGTVLKAYLNGVEKTPNGGVSTLGTWSEGQPGIGFWPVDSATPGNYGWSDWTCGSL